MLHSRPTFITYKKVRKEEKLVSVIENEKWLYFSLSEVFFFLLVYVSKKDISVTPNVSDQSSGVV